MTEYVKVPLEELDALFEARDAAERRATEYFNLLCKFKGLADVYAGNFDEALMNATPDPRTLPKRPKYARD